MADFKNFSFKNINVIFGIDEIEGFAEGDDAVSIEYDADQFVKIVGAKGDVVRTQTADSSSSMTVKLLQTSKSNGKLMAMFNLDRETGSNALPFIVNDKETGESHVVNNAWIIKPPAIIRGANLNVMEWSFQGDFLTSVLPV
jgi:hypothetical protein